IRVQILKKKIRYHSGAYGLEPEEGASFQGGILDLPWQDELCCDSPSAHLVVEGDGTHAPKTNRSESNLPHNPRCIFRSLTTESHPHQPSGTCLDILCRIDENWEKVTCDLQSHSQPSDTLDAALMAISLQRLLSQKDDSGVNNGPNADDNPVVCEAVDSFMCSVALGNTTNLVTVVTVSISDAVAPPVLLRSPARPEKPSPPVNLSHIQTIEAELILQWADPSDSPADAGSLRYEVRYSSNSTHPVWQVSTALTQPRLSLNLKPRLNYTIQVRSSGPYEPPLWSDWSETHHIFLQTVSYIPDTVVARPGENVTVYCVFNDHSINASTAAWVLNFQQPIHPSQYHTVNQWVSQVTVRPSETRMYDLLRCTQEWSIPYSQIYVEGASIDITCETNGDIDAMDCSWKNTQLTKPKFQYRWADLPCDVMEERERAGEEVGEMGPDCLQVRSRQETCTIQPLRMNCYKLWLEEPYQLGPVRSKPTYLSPIDHVKPDPPSNVKAVSQSSGVLMVTWEPPSLPVEGLQCQFRYHSPSSVRGQPEWKVQSPVRIPSAEVAVPDMCSAYVVQARCMHTNGTGYWSDWSESVYSTAQSKVPERGPDFWRILQDDPYRNETNVTLLFEPFPISDHSYCVDGFIVQHQTMNGPVTREQIDIVSSYSFEWNQELHTVTVEAYNSLGSSANNTIMTLDRQPKRRSVRSFHVSVINTTCVSLSWSLLDNSSVPLFMVVQWLPHRQQDSDMHTGQNGETWVRLRYTEHPVYLRGDFFDSEEFGFYLHPVFADGEGEAVYAIATGGNPAAYVMLMMLISFLSVVLLVTLVISQNQMKRLVWKDVPNPNKCSWAKGLDFKKVETFDHLFRTAESLQAWPLLLPSENISTVVIMEKADLSALTTALIQTPLVSLSPDPATTLTMSPPPGFDSKVEQTQFMENEELPGGVPTFALHPSIDELLPVDPPADELPVATDSSAQSSVTYASVLHSDPKPPSPLPLNYKDGSGSSSSDEGNFSANNSDISGSFPGGLWELDSCRGGEMEDPRRSCSYNSVEELSETEQQDEGDVKTRKDLYYLGMDYPAEDEESEEEEEQREEETKTELLKNVVLNSEDCCVELHPLLGPQDSSKPTELPSMSTCGFSPMYLPQFRTVPCTRQLHDSKPNQ
uniref:Fibronectin type-III domain-containing protein n=1 Tax=Anabas testudineus TaxID=64144 RepID=A0A7N5ZZW8_ANATE